MMKSKGVTKMQSAQMEPKFACWSRVKQFSKDDGEYHMKYQCSHCLNVFTRKKDACPICKCVMMGRYA